MVFCSVLIVRAISRILFAVLILILILVWFGFGLFPDFDADLVNFPLHDFEVFLFYFLFFFNACLNPGAYNTS